MSAITTREGYEFPNLLLNRFNAQGKIEPFQTHDALTGRRVVVFTASELCHNKRLADFMRAANAILDLGVDKIICITPDNTHFLKGWDYTKIDIWEDTEQKILLPSNTTLVIDQLKVEWMNDPASNLPIVTYLNNVRSDPLADIYLSLLQSENNNLKGEDYERNNT